MKDTKKHCFFAKNERYKILTTTKNDVAPSTINVTGEMFGYVRINIVKSEN